MKFTPVLAKHSKSLNLVDSISVEFTEIYAFYHEKPSVFPQEWPCISAKQYFSHSTDAASLCALLGMALAVELPRIYNSEINVRISPNLTSIGVGRPETAGRMASR